MNEYQVDGLHYTTAQPVRVTSRAGEITAIDSLPHWSGAQRWIAPSLFDVQVNGYASVDFQQDNLTVDHLLAASRALRRDGCARYFHTLITDEWSRLLARLRHARSLRQDSAELKKSMAGWHIEGPFLSEVPGYCGAHNPAMMCDPTPQHIQQLREVTDGDPVLLTLAPERPGAIEAIKEAAALGIKISLGHTNASSGQLQAAIAAGATGFTHLANGCPRELDRHDNIVWRVCDLPGLTISLIPDGIHVSPAPFRAIHRLLDSIYYTTDAMAAGGAPVGRYRIGAVEVEVGSDQVVRQPGKTNFAGSALRPIEGVQRAARMLNRPWQECWLRMSEAPAQFAGVAHGLRVGAPAAFCVLSEIPDGGLELESST